MQDNTHKKISAALKSFFVPHVLNLAVHKKGYKVCAIIPSFKPGPLTLRLVDSLLRWNKDISVYVVDDCTPESYEAEYGFFRAMQNMSKRVTFMRTQKNKMKAGAINYALGRIAMLEVQPDVIITLDDDVVIERNTIRNLVSALMADERLGAACSQCRALNKNKNILTRLQGLEYLGFNAIRLADEGFFHGPLVMHGMLTAFRAEAILQVNGFVENHLIEDYEITTRLKSCGWHVRLAPNSYAWTEVPETFGQLWKQRTRWIYGGITVVFGVKYWPAVIQDIIGHVMFLLTLFIILGSIVFYQNGTVSRIIVDFIIAVSVIQAIMWYLFSLWFMRFYVEKDRTDWVIRSTLVLEFLYANILTFVLLGAYAFYIFNMASSRFSEERKYIGGTIRMFRRGFARIGYTSGWGTRLPT